MIDGFYMPNGEIDKYNYDALVNKPESDDTLSVEGGFADAKAVGDALSELRELIEALQPST